MIYRESDDDDGRFVFDVRLFLDVDSRSLRSSVFEVEGLVIVKSWRSLILKRVKVVW